MSTPYSTHVYDEVTSTQDVARSLAGEGPVLVIAARQTAGRGRSGSVWESAPRSVAASLHLLLDERNWPRARRTLLPLVTGIAVARQHRLDLKWPNDLMAGEAKVGGVLLEAQGEAVTIGVGLNLSWPEPPPAWAALWPTDPGPERYVSVGAELGKAIWAEVDLGAARWRYEDYCAACITIGQSITWNEAQAGRALGVDRLDGGLIVEQASGSVKLNAGEIRHVRAD